MEISSQHQTTKQLNSGEGTKVKVKAEVEIKIKRKEYAALRSLSVFYRLRTQRACFWQMSPADYRQGLVFALPANFQERLLHFLQNQGQQQRSLYQAVAADLFLVRGQDFAHRTQPVEPGNGVGNMANVRGAPAVLFADAYR